MNRPASLFFTFAKIGLFTFGGGYAMISIIENHCVEQKKWITHDEMLNITIIAESTPGPIAINAATYVGFQQAGILGAAAATIGVVFPSFLIIYTISMFLDHFLELAFISNALKGIKIGVGILILNAGITMARKLEKKVLTYAIMLGSFTAMLLINIFSLDFSSISLMLAAAFISLAVFLAKGGGKK
ncbi:chromate transporter [Lachnospiraceae bacterium 62-35]